MSFGSLYSVRQPLRSLLFTPGNHLDRLRRARDRDADVIIADLEDAVPAPDKIRARRDVLDWLADGVGRPSQHALRMNAIVSRDGLADFCAILDLDAEPDLIVVPKAESPDVLRMLDRVLHQQRKNPGLIAMIESTAGLQCCEAIANATPRIAGLLFGAADMASDLGTRPTWHALAYARARIVAAAATASVAALDSPYFSIGDIAGLQREAEAAAELGFSGKAAIHPRQIGTINGVFSPTAFDVQEAAAILEASRAGVGIVGGQMVDEAMGRRARRVLAAAGRLSVTR